MCSSFDPYHTDPYSFFRFSAREDFLEVRDVRVKFQSHYYFSHACLLACLLTTASVPFAGWLAVHVSQSHTADGI